MDILQDLKQNGLHKGNIDTFRQLVEANLSIIEKALGVKCNIGSGHYDRTGVSYKIEFVVNEQAKNYTESFKLGLPPDIIGRNCLIRGKMFTVAGLDSSKPKNCVKIEDAEGKVYTTNIETILHTLIQKNDERHERTVHVEIA
jgi:hypothetical protein